MSVAFISHPDCGRHDTGWGHPEHVGRLRAITRALRETPSLFESVEQIVGREASRDELALAHNVDYIDSIRRASEAGGAQLDADTVASEGTWSAAIAGAGCILDAVDRAMTSTDSRSFCAVRPPGHHALASRAMGFCIFGNVALAAHYARAAHGAHKVLIVDWDVHHGNGTQALVEATPDIHFVSMHQWPWYPGTGAAEDRGPHNSIWNIPLPPGLDRTRYVQALERGIDDATKNFTPDLILISAGFDSMRGDPLGGFTLEVDDFVEFTQRLVHRARDWCKGRLVSSLEGGYAPEALAKAVVAHIAALQ